MFDPTSRIQSAHLHGQDLHHAARHRTHHAADHALLRRAPTSSAATEATEAAPATPVGSAGAPGRTHSTHRPTLSLRGLGARYRMGRLAHRSA